MGNFLESEDQTSNQLDWFSAQPCTHHSKWLISQSRWLFLPTSLKGLPPLNLHALRIKVAGFF